MTVSEAEVPEGSDLLLGGAGDAVRGPVVGSHAVRDRHEEAKHRVGAMLRDKAVASTKGVREVQLKLDAGWEEFLKSRSELLLLKKSILLKKEELATLKREEIQAEQTVDLWAKRIAGWESTKSILWMGCVDNVTGLASHVTDIPTFASSDARPSLVKNLVDIDNRLAMERIRKETHIVPREVADYSMVVRSGGNGREVELIPTPAVEEPRGKPVVSRRPDQEQWSTAGGRRGQGQVRKGKAMLLITKDKIPPAGKYRYGIKFIPSQISNTDFLGMSGESSNSRSLVLATWALLGRSISAWPRWPLQCWTRGR